jgi:hypothetical protein
MALIGALGEHKLFAAFCAVVIALGLALGATPALAASVVAVCLLPGYLLLLAVAEQTQVERAVTAFPASVILVAVVTIVPAILFDAKSVDPAWVAGGVLAVMALLFFSGAKKTLPDSRERQAAVLSLLALAFVIATSLVAYGSLNQPANNMVWSIDAVLQYDQISWMAQRHDNSVPPAFNPSWKELFGVNLVPPSVASQAVLTQLSGPAYWNANAFFLVMVFATMVLGVFLLFAAIGDIGVGFVAGLAVALPFKLQYVWPFYFGLWREIFSMMLTPLAIYYCIKTIRSRGKDAPALAVVLLLLAVTHPVTGWGVAASVAIVVACAVFDHQLRGALLKPLAVSAVLFAILMIPVAPAFGEGSEYYPFGGGSLFTSPAVAEANYGYLVGPTLVKLEQTHVWLALAALGGLALLFLHSRREKPLLSGENGFTHLALDLAVTLAVASAVITFLGPYALKQRFDLMIDFVVPLAAVFILLALRLVTSKIAGIKSGVPAFAAAVIVVVLLSQPWAYAFPQPANGLVSADSGQELRKPAITWDIIDYLRQNTPIDSRVLFFGFIQYSGCLAERRCYEVSAHAAVAKYQNATSAYSRAIEVNALCRRDVRKTGFLQYEPVACSENFGSGNICNYDYIVIGYFPYTQYPEYPLYLQQLVARLSANYQPVLQRGLFGVYKQVKHDENCLPAS